MANLLIPYENDVIFSQFIGKYNSKFVIQVHLANPLDFKCVMVDKAFPYQSNLAENLAQWFFFPFFVTSMHLRMPCVQLKKKNSNSKPKKAPF